MLRPVCLLLLCFCGGALAQAGVAPEPEITPAPSVKFSSEVESKAAYAGDASTEIGHGRRGALSQQDAAFHAVLSPQWGDGPLYRFGLAYQRASFGLPERAALPNTLQSTAVLIGVDFAVRDSWLVRVEAQPGLYSDFHDLDRGDWNIPVQIGVTYIAGASLQLVAALSINVDHQYPVIPVVGFRWNIAGPWTLNALLPAPRLEYEWRKGLTFFAGAEVRSDTYRVSSDFGESHGERRLNAAIVEYDEVRLGGGVTWKAAPGVQVELSGGYLPYREFNYHRADLSLETKSGSAYGQVGVSAKF